MEQKITFPKTGHTTYTNRETGVTIERVYRDGGNWYEVRRPALTSTGYVTVRRTSYLRHARFYAKDWVVPDARDDIARAFEDAVDEAVNRAERKLTGATGAGSVSRGDGAHRTLNNWLCAAINARHRGEHQRALAWVYQITTMVRRLIDERDRQVQPFIERVREYRTITGCGLKTGRDTVIAQDEMAARLTAACRSGDSAEIVAALDDAAYLSTAYSRTRVTGSHLAAMMSGRMAVVVSLKELAADVNRALASRRWYPLLTEPQENGATSSPDADVDPEEARRALSAKLGAPADRMEILKACVDHPDTSAVDCTICAPEV